MHLIGDPNRTTWKSKFHKLWDMLNPIMPLGIIVKQLQEIALRVIPGDVLGGIYDRIVAGEEFVDREIGSKHTSIYTRNRNCFLNIWTIDSVVQLKSPIPSPEILQATFSASASIFIALRHSSKCSMPSICMPV